MMGRTLDPKTLVVNQAKTSLGNNPKAKTKHYKLLIIRPCLFSTYLISSAITKEHCFCTACRILPDFPPHDRDIMIKCAAIAK